MQIPLEVTDMKQYAYCPRVVFYHYCLPDIRPTTFKMEAGIAAHTDEIEREGRRSLRAYGLTTGERHFDVWVQDDELGIRGRLDMAVVVPDRAAPDAEVIPVEYKLSERTPGRHFKIQLAMYGMLLEAMWGLPVRRGFIYLIPLRRAVEVRITSVLRRQAREEIAAIRTMIATETIPAPPTNRRPCVSCEFRRFCNDVI
jgi:CRISPR-associated exonuclease Cas4